MKIDIPTKKNKLSSSKTSGDEKFLKPPTLMVFLEWNGAGVWKKYITRHNLKRLSIKVIYISENIK